MSAFFVFLIRNGGTVLPTPPAAPKSPKDDTGTPNTNDETGSSEDRRRQLAELVGRLLARQWVDSVLVKPMPGEGTNHPP